MSSASKHFLSDCSFWRSWRPDLTKKDILWIAGITFIYAAIAFTNLGAFEAPQTYWTASSPNESVMIEFYSPSDVQKLYFYGGICNEQNFTVDFYNSNMNLLDTKEIKYKQNTMFRWHIYSGESVGKNLGDVKFVKVTAQKKGFTAFEFAFLSRNQSFVSISKSWKTSDPSTSFDVLVDEQSVIPTHPTYMNRSYFDEIYHARTAYEHIHGISPYDTSHPPMGKVIISVGILIFGMVPFGWRFMGTLIGVLMIPFMYLLALQLFKRRSLAVLSSLALSFDFMHYTQTRISTIDGIATFFIILMFYFMFRYILLLHDDVPFRERMLPLALCGIFMGFGVATKWNCVYAGFGLALLFFGAHVASYLKHVKKTQDLKLKQKEYDTKKYKKELIRTFLFCIGFFVIAPLILYCLAYIPHLAPTGYSLDSLIRAQIHMYNYHTTLVSTHPYASPWWSWPIMQKPLWYYVDTYPMPGMTGNIYAFGNPAVWWPGIVSIIALPIGVLLRKKWRFDISAWCLIIAFYVQYLPWIPVERTTYIYYYFPCSVFATLAIFWWANQLLNKTDQIDDIDQKKKVHMLLLIVGVLYVALIVGLFVFYYPILSGAEITREYTDFLKTVFIQIK